VNDHNHNHNRQRDHIGTIWTLSGGGCSSGEGDRNRAQWTDGAPRLPFSPDGIGNIQLSGTIASRIAARLSLYHTIPSPPPGRQYLRGHRGVMRQSRALLLVGNKHDGGRKMAIGKRVVG